MRTHALALTIRWARAPSRRPARPARVFFPTHPGGPGPYPAALFDGTLEVAHGCVYLTDHGERWLGLWPADLRAACDGGRLRIVDEAGRVVAVEGGRIRAGGGEGRPGDIPERCGHLYWLVSGVET